MYNMAIARLFRKRSLELPLNLRYRLTSSLNRTKKSTRVEYDYAFGSQGALFAHNNHRRLFQTKSQIKPIYNLIKNVREMSMYDSAKLLQDARSVLHNYAFVLPINLNNKSLYLFSIGDSDQNRNSGKDDDDDDDDDDDESEEPPYPADGQPPGNNFMKFFMVFVLPIIVISLLRRGGSSMAENQFETSWESFLLLMLQTGEVQSLRVNSEKDKVFVYLSNGAIINGREAKGFGPHYYFTIGNFENFDEKLREAQERLGIDARNFITVKYQAPDSGIFSTFVAIVFTVAVMSALYLLLGGKKAIGRAGGMDPFSSITRAKATIILPGTGKGIGFKDVAGMAEAKVEVKEFVDYLQYPARFKKLGAKIPSGALLCGQPGTGKTLLAKAVSTEANVPFLAMAGSDFVEEFGGVGPARVRSLFKQARNHAPCIVYIDEIDAIGKSRKSTSNYGGNSEQESTLNQLLVEMDGMNTVEGVVMLASTNRPDILDQALLRPGRFDRNITIDLPILPERKDIFKIYLKQLTLGQSLHKYSDRLAELTPGKSGADIANICNEAALHAARLNEKVVDEKNFEYAIERVIAGIQKKNNPLSPQERSIVAYHEAGHAIVSWMLKHTEPILKISTIPRVQSPLGFTQKFPLDIKLHTSDQLHDMMCTLLGGRTAESLVFNRITTGAEDDLRKVTELAYRQITFYGMNKRIGPISFPLKEKGELSKKFYGDKLAREIDEEASLMVMKAHKLAEQLLKENRDKLELLAKTLLEKEVLNYADLVELLGEGPHGDKIKDYYSARSVDASNAEPSVAA